MKTVLLLLFSTVFSVVFSVKPFKEGNFQTISFNVRGNSKTNVSLGVGYQVGAGACCRGVSKETTVAFQGNIGDVLYDANTKRVITKIHAGMKGKTIDLRQYY